jgi:hypothetical protein
MVMIMMIDQDEYEQSTNSQQQQQIRKRNHTQNTQQFNNHTVALPFTLEKYLKAKEEESWKLKYFTACKKYNLQKNSSTRNQNPSTYYY